MLVVHEATNAGHIHILTTNVGPQVHVMERSGIHVAHLGLCSVLYTCSRSACSVLWVTVVVCYSHVSCCSLTIVYYVCTHTSVLKEYEMSIKSYCYYISTDFHIHIDSTPIASFPGSPLAYAYLLRDL